MTVEDASSWSFTGPVTDDCSVECRECSGWFPLSSWVESEVFCEDCGEHRAMMCPGCGERYDHVWSDDKPLRVKNPECQNQTHEGVW